MTDAIEILEKEKEYIRLQILHYLLWTNKIDHFYVLHAWCIVWPRECIDTHLWRIFFVLFIQSSSLQPATATTQRRRIMSIYALGHAPALRNIGWDIITPCIRVCIILTLKYAVQSQLYVISVELYYWIINIIYQQQSSDETVLTIKRQNKEKRSWFISMCFLRVNFEKIV